MAKKSVFDDLLDDINKRYAGKGEGPVIVKAKESEALKETVFVPTGILSLDVALGGGIPTSRIVYLRGEYSSGKSLVALKSAAAFQRTCRNCGKPLKDWDEVRMVATPRPCCKDPEPCRVVWMDAEKCYDNRWAARMGVDPDHVYVMRTEFAEQAIDVADDVIRSGHCDLLVVDSVAHLTPSTEVTESAEKWQMGLHARLMNKAMRVWGSAMAHDSLDRPLGCTVMLINQIRHKIGIVYGSPETSPGGKGIDFAASVILKMKKKGFIQNDLGIVVGQEMELTTSKSKLAPPQRSVIFDVMFVNDKSMGRLGGSSNLAHQVLRLADFWGLVERAGSWYTLAKGVKFQGEDKAAEFLMTSDGKRVLDMLVKQIMKREKAWSDEGSVYGG